MLPFFVMNNIINQRPAYAERLSKRPLRYSASFVKPTDEQYLILGEFIRINFFSMPDRSVINGIVHVRDLCVISQILNPVICFITVIVTHLSTCRWLPYKRTCNHAMSKKMTYFPVARKRDMNITVSANLLFKYSQWRFMDDSMIISERSNSPKITNFISWVIRDFSPFLLIVHENILSRFRYMRKSTNNNLDGLSKIDIDVMTDLGYFDKAE